MTALSHETIREVQQAAYAADKTVQREAVRVLAHPTRETLRATCSLQEAIQLTHPAVMEDFGFSSIQA